MAREEINFDAFSSQNGEISATEQGKSQESSGISGENGGASPQNQQNSRNSSEPAQNSSIFEENPPLSVDNSPKTDNLPSKMQAEEKSAESEPLKTEISPIERLFSKESEELFKQDFPALDLEKVKKNKDFQAFLGALTQYLTLSQLYLRFSALVSSIEESSSKKMAYALANADTGVGSLSSQGATEETFFTKEQVLRMSPEQIRKNYDKIRRSQQKW